ncbi:MAG: hypothetical protein DYH13_00370 [Alphaproteobacteria bacterium PRO2]|nr:hypothetical protein [Alphaproteobacteria bacterium PRO2]
MRIEKPSALHAFLLAVSMLGATATDSDASATAGHALDLKTKISVCTKYNQKMNALTVSQAVPIDISPKIFENLTEIYNQNMKLVVATLLEALGFTDQQAQIQAVLEEKVKEINSYNGFYTPLALAAMNPEMDPGRAHEITRSLGDITFTPVEVTNGCSSETEQLAYKH